MEPRGRLIRQFVSFNRGLASGGSEKDMPTSQVKPFDIPKQMVWEAYRRVAANKGAPGVDGQTVAEFESDLKDNLYKVWNRMSSGSYFPPPVKGVEIPKPHGGGVRLLGVPTVADRVAQTVVAMHLEERAEPRFHPDSYGYRPRKAAWEAVEACRQRCWKYDWVIDLDVQKFFDTVPWDLVVKAVEAVCDTPWVLLYVKRWLSAPLQLPDGTVVERDKGTPQGSAVSPILANLFMHYALDRWLARNYPGCPFERYADDAVVHCVSRQQAEAVLEAIAARMAEVGLRLPPGQDADRLLQGRDAPGGLRAHLLHLPRVHLPHKEGAQQDRAVLRKVPASDEHRGAQGQRRRASLHANPSAHGLVPGRPGPMDEPHCGRVDELLRPVLPVEDDAPPPACQRLPETLGWDEVSEAADPQAVQAVVDGTDRSTAPSARPMAVGPLILTC